MYSILMKAVIITLTSLMQICAQSFFISEKTTKLEWDRDLRKKATKYFFARTTSPENVV